MAKNMMPMLAGVGLLSMCCISSSIAASMMGSKEKEDQVVPKTPEQIEADKAKAVETETETEPETNEEVFQVKGYQFSGPAQGLNDAGCIKYGGVVATKDQVYAAQAAGADWCSTGWTRDHPTPMYPINTSLQQGCGNGAAQVVEYKPPNASGKSYPLAALNCYGVKPVKTTPVDGVTVFEKLHNWNDEKWSKYD